MKFIQNGQVGYAHIIGGILVISWEDGTTEWFR